MTEEKAKTYTIELLPSNIEKLDAEAKKTNEAVKNNLIGL